MQHITAMFVSRSFYPDKHNRPEHAECCGISSGNICFLFVNRDHINSSFCETVVPEASTEWESQSGNNASPCLTVNHQSVGFVFSIHQFHTSANVFNLMLDFTGPVFT